MMSWKTLFVSIVALSTSSGVVFGGCDIAGLEAMPDGAWLVSLNGSWRPIDELSVTLTEGRSRDLTFAYVAREPELTTFRRGMLVIKTAVRASAAGSADRVALARDAYKPIEKCKSYPSFPGGSVKGRSYDEYHDYSYSAKGADGPLLSSFHVSYAARVQGCKNSNDNSATPILLETGRAIGRSSPSTRRSSPRGRTASSSRNSESGPPMRAARCRSVGLR